MRNFLAAGLVLLLLALGLAVWKLQQLEDRVSVLELEDKKLREQAEHPTRFIGNFPDNMSEIVRMVNATTSKLLIVNDYCAYGHYSKPSGYQEYKSALIGLVKKDLLVDVFVYDRTATDQATTSQFGTDFNQIKESPKFKAYFKFYENDASRPVPKNLDEFVTLMVKEQDRCVQELSTAGVHVHQSIRAVLPVFIWLRDGEEGIVSMYNLGESAREVSLLTKDRNLLTMLEEISIQARQQAVAQQSQTHGNVASNMR